MLNALILCAVLFGIPGSRAGLPRLAAKQAAVLGSALWALHPLWTSTCSYIVQRHALLATLFVLLGIWSWLLAQQHFAAGRRRSGWALALVSIIGFGTLAGLSKPNGFLLPLLLLALQLCSADSKGMAAVRRPEVLLLLGLPSLIIIGGLVLAGFADAPDNRPWTVAERLLTQPRVVTAYLGQLFLPGVYSGAGFLPTTFLSRRDCWIPLDTLFTGVAVCLAGGGTRTTPVGADCDERRIVLFRRPRSREHCAAARTVLRAPQLPSALLFWPIAVLCTKPGAALNWRRLGAVALLVLFALLTLARASLWGQPLLLSLTWARDLPDSARAQTYAAAMLIDAGQADLAIARLEPLLLSSSPRHSTPSP